MVEPRPLDEIAMEYVAKGGRNGTYTHCRMLFLELITRAGLHETQVLINQARQTARMVGL